jgi:hypothetical protein
MIAGARSDHAAAFFIVAEQQNAVQRAALFESSGALQIIQLQIHLLTGHLGKGSRALAGREVDEIANSLFGLLYLYQGNVHILLKHFSSLTKENRQIRVPGRATTHPAGSR